MLALQQFIDEHNAWSTVIKNHKPWKIPTSPREAEPMFQSLEGKLSPENLHCDGEISIADARAKYNWLMKVYADLEAIVGKRKLVY